mmetsp:Transcript_17746/g.37160  ORF Transcript_17746/g.37160 Transcript_17746/m.37160 type:complete len:205 (-) Transcript_17746:19-633(-)
MCSTLANTTLHLPVSPAPSRPNSTAPIFSGTRLAASTMRALTCSVAMLFGIRCTSSVRSYGSAAAPAPLPPACAPLPRPWPPPILETVRGTSATRRPVRVAVSAQAYVTRASQIESCGSSWSCPSSVAVRSRSEQVEPFWPLKMRAVSTTRSCVNWSDLRSLSREWPTRIVSVVQISRSTACACRRVNVTALRWLFSMPWMCVT